MQMLVLVYFDYNVSKMLSFLSITYFIFVEMNGVVCLYVIHLSLGDRENMFIIRIIIILLLLLLSLS